MADAEIIECVVSGLDYVERIAVLYLLWKAEQRQRQRRRRPWVRRILQRGSQFSECHRLLQELRLDDGRFQRYFRLSRTQFEDLLSRVGGRITLRDTNYRRPISADERLSICLRVQRTAQDRAGPSDQCHQWQSKKGGLILSEGYLATGDSYRTIADSFQVGISTVCGIVPQVVAAIWDCLVQEFMAVPSIEDWRTIAAEFQQRWNFPLCCGVVDGKHVQLEVPPCNHQGDFPIVLLAVVDAQYRFRMIDVGAYGRTSDGSILANSVFGQALRAGTLHLPPDQHLPGAEHRGLQPHLFVADEAFPLRRNVMRPFPRFGRGILPPEENVFNYRLSRARMVVEDTFSILTSQWRWYRRLIEVRSEVVKSCVKATCALHNFMRASGGAEPPLRGLAAGQLPLRGLGRLGANNSSKEARRVRDIFKEYFMAEGAVPGQPTE